MSRPVTISLDAMGGDFGPEVVIPGALQALQNSPDLNLVLVGDEATLKNKLASEDDALCKRITIHHASQVVGMDEPPSKALRGKKDSSMRVAINLVKEGQADACVSAGNTGALMATARFVLKTIPGIERPAIMSALPSMDGHTHMLDLGANVDSSAEHLFQFAVMADAVVRAVEDNDNPSVGLLNIGSEDIKGNTQVKEAHQLLQGTYLNYIGFVEGDDIYKGGVDIVVTDGFVGNVALKTSEGLAKMVGTSLKSAFKASLMSKLAGLISMPVLKRFRQRIDPDRYNGATLMGLRGIVIKSHGGANANAFANAIRIAELEVQTAVPDLIGRQVAEQLTEGQAV